MLPHHPCALPLLSCARGAAQEFVGAADEAYAQLGTLVQRLNTDTRLYHALVETMAAAEAAGWGKEQRRMAQLLRADFERGGVHLDEAGRDEVVGVQDDIVKNCAHFHSNINSGRPPTVAIPLSIARSLPSSIRPFISAGTTADMAVLHVTSTVMGMVLRGVWDETVRKDVFIAYHSNSLNVATLESLLDARRRLASKLGFPSYAAYALDEKMAKTPARVRAFLKAVHGGVLAKAEAEAEVLQNIKRECGQTGVLSAWDMSIYRSMAKSKAMPPGSSALSEYLPLSRSFPCPPFSATPTPSCAPQKIASFSRNIVCLCDA